MDWPTPIEPTVALYERQVEAVFSDPGSRPVLADLGTRLEAAERVAALWHGLLTRTGRAGLLGRGIQNKRVFEEYRDYVLEGVPCELRQLVWLSGSNVFPGQVEELLSRVKMEDAQIAKDCKRTMRTHSLFKDPHGAGLTCVRNALTAFSVKYPNVGYIQGMNLIAAGGFLALGSSDEVFCLLECAVVILGPTFFSDAIKSFCELLVHDHLRYYLPKTYHHLVHLGTDIVAVLCGWMLLLLVEILPEKALFLTWDAVFGVDGKAGLVKTTLLVFEALEDDITLCLDAGEVYCCLYDVKTRLEKIGFSESLVQLRKRFLLKKRWFSS